MGYSKQEPVHQGQNIAMQLRNDLSGQKTNTSRQRGLRVIASGVSLAHQYDVIIEAEFDDLHWDKSTVDRFSKIIKEQGFTTNIIMTGGVLRSEIKKYAQEKGIDLAGTGEFPKKSNTGLFQQIVKQNK